MGRLLVLALALLVTGCGEPQVGPPDAPDAAPQPTRLSGPIGVALTIDETHVYVASPVLRGVAAIPKDGGPLTLLANDVEIPARTARPGIAVAGDHVYYSTAYAGRAALKRVSRAGGVPETLVTVELDPEGLVPFAVAGGDAYLVAGRQLIHVDLASQVSTPVAAELDGERIDAVALTTSYVFYVTNRLDHDGIARLPRGAAPATEAFWRSLPDASSLVTNGEEVAVGIAGESAALWRIHPAPPRTLLEGGSLYALAASEDEVFVQMGDRLYRRPFLPEGSPVQVAVLDQSVTALAVDATRIYFLDYEGTLWSLPR